MVPRTGQSSQTDLHNTMEASKMVRQFWSDVISDIMLKNRDETQWLTNCCPGVWTGGWSGDASFIFIYVKILELETLQSNILAPTLGLWCVSLSCGTEIVAGSLQNIVSFNTGNTCVLGRMCFLWNSSWLLHVDTLNRSPMQARTFSGSKTLACKWSTYYQQICSQNSL